MGLGSSLSALHAIASQTSGRRDRHGPSTENGSDSDGHNVKCTDHEHAYGHNGDNAIQHTATLNTLIGKATSPAINRVFDNKASISSASLVATPSSGAKSTTALTTDTAVTSTETIRQGCPPATAFASPTSYSGTRVADFAAVTTAIPAQQRTQTGREDNRSSIIVSLIPSSFRLASPACQVPALCALRPLPLLQLVSCLRRDVVFCKRPLLLRSD